MKQGKCIVHEKEIFPTSGLFVGNGLESSCISRIR